MHGLLYPWGCRGFGILINILYKYVLDYIRSQNIKSQNNIKFITINCNKLEKWLPVYGSCMSTQSCRSIH